MRAVNLLPRDDGRRRTRRNDVPIAVAGGGFLLVLTMLAVLAMSAGSTVAAKQKLLDEKKSELSLVPPPPPSQSPQEQALAGQRQGRVVALSSALSRRVMFDRVLRQLSLVLPSDVWLTSLSAKAPTSPSSAVATAPAANAPPTGLTLHGSTYSHASVARLLARLQVIPDLTNVQLQQSALLQVGTQEIVQFTINADLRTSGPVT